ncbi:hypothetical protein [Acanthopleuribacter pedis]|uniref:Transmembrane protein n=1 Tax=Acanthopleuribacter pedis TaxID=442870 RepID=A0A8J7QQY5_9BACT|nr:hypothetical protein [Acanthopleuribacter pedis]MBO1322823.1 hypothetical protein [Acanthopleuribacter pedis]
MKSLNSRSIRLQSRPRRSLGLPAHMVRRRLLGVLSAATLLLTAVVVLRFRLLDPRGWGYALYWIHDTLYLPLIGYGLRLFWPWSLIWWGVGAVFALVWLAWFLSAPTLLQQPRLKITHYLLSRPRYHGLLVKAATWPARAGFPQTLLLDHLEMLWRIRADQTAGKREPNAAPLADLALLYDRLRPLHDTHHRLVALQLLTSTWVALRCFGGDDSALVTALKTRVLGMLTRRGEGYLLVTHLRHTPITLAGELAGFLARQDNALRHRLIGEDGETQLDAATLQRRLGNHFSERQTALFQLHQTLGRVLREPDQPGYQLDCHDPVSDRIEIAHLALLGQIECDCVALNALDGGEAARFTAWLEHLHMLRFSLQALPQDILAEDRAERLHAYYGSLPRDLDTRIAAVLAEQAARRRTDEHPFDAGFEQVWRGAWATADLQREQLALPIPDGGA